MTVDLLVLCRGEGLIVDGEVSGGEYINLSGRQYQETGSNILLTSYIICDLQYVRSFFFFAGIRFQEPPRKSKSATNWSSLKIMTCHFLVSFIITMHFNLSYALKPYQSLNHRIMKMKHQKYFYVLLVLLCGWFTFGFRIFLCINAVTGSSLFFP